MQVNSHPILNTAPTIPQLDSLYGRAQGRSSSKLPDSEEDKFEATPSTNETKAKSLVSPWDIPGVITFSWLQSTVNGLRSTGDYSGPIGRAIGLLMVLASPVVIPATLAADTINTVIFPAKVIYRALHKPT